MEAILFTKGKNLTVKTCYLADSQEFGIVFEYPNGDSLIVEKFKSALFMLEFHNFWCRFTGIISEDTNANEITTHVRKAS